MFPSSSRITHRMKCGNHKIWSLWWTIVLFVLVSARAQYQPNVVFIMVDDMGWNDVSFHGSDQILTPNIDTLAYRGIILQHYYSEAICTPARTALLTGKYPMRLGMHGMPLFNSEDRGIPLTERLLPSYLKELGYSTHLVGKWHVGMSRPEYLPTSRGYDSHYGMRGGFIDYYTYNKVESWPDGRFMFGMDLFDNDVPQEQEQRYIIDALTDRAVEIIRYHNTSRPLFLHLAHNAPHAGNSGGNLQPPLNSPVKNSHIANSDRRLYANVVADIDRSVGNVVRALAQKGILDDTLIVFVSDNGAPTDGTFSNWGLNIPLRGKKYTPWEGGVRVPAFVWHSSFRPRIWNGLMHISDWLPTITAAAGGQLDTKIDGINQWDSIIRDEESKRREVLLILEDGESNSYAAYRAGDYKIVVGNVTGVSNDYYGAEFLPNRASPPPYYPTLSSCDVARIFENRGMYLDYYQVAATRSAATIKQEDPVKDPTPCVPTPTRGCLFNIRRDPTESHDLWQQANQIALLLTSRLRGLWSNQRRRGPPNLYAEADPANFGYNWMTWIPANAGNSTVNRRTNATPGSQSKPRNNVTGSKNTTTANVINCNAETGIRNFLCLLKSVF